MASTQVMADQTTSPQALASRLRDYYTLTKPEVNLLILMTTSAGYYLGSEGEFKIGRLVSTLIGTLLVASGTATLNQFMERRYDAQMRRTANRPLVSGRLSAREAFWFGILLSVAGGLYLALAVNTLAALLAVSTLLTRRLHAPELSSGLHSIKKKDSAMYRARSDSRGHAYADWLGRSLCRHRPASLAVICHSFSVAVPAFPGDCPHVSRRLFARRLPDVAVL